MGMPELATPAATALKMRVGGMDCSACALKIENALKRQRGVSEVSVNYGIETLTLRIDQGRISLGAVEQQIRALGYAPKVLDGGSVGRAISAAARSRGLTIAPIFGGSTVIPGKAVQARLRTGFFAVGSPRYAAELAPIPSEVSDRILGFESEGKTVVILLAKDRIIGLIALRDEPRTDAHAGIARLRALGVRTVMLTGDNQRTADAIARALSLETRAGLLPVAKLEAIAALKSQGSVAMVGDGINDAPALAASSIGIAMGGGADVALEAADAALLKNRVQGVAEMVELSRATLRNIWQNITIALGLKIVFLATTLLRVTSLWMAILADTGATVIVTANALRLLRVRTSLRGSRRYAPWLAALDRCYPPRHCARCR
jgi:Cd2+/Zn2+-exporting ATPase